MRYIPKNETPQFLTEWIAEQENAGVRPTYDGFREKSQLNGLLRAEQKHICCYCQQRLLHFQGKNQGGSHNEHLVPQSGPHGDPAQALDYHNLYSCCNYSNGTKGNKRHCGEAKGDQPIPDLLKREECSQYFKYNVLGEILPNGSYNRYQDYLDNEEKLDIPEQEALRAIRVLNLNCTYLTTERRELQTKLFKLLPAIPQERLERQAEMLERRAVYYIFVDMLLYYIRRML